MKNIRLALVIQNCSAGQFDVNLQAFETFTLQAKARGADMVVFPEMNLTGYVSGEKIRDIARPITQDLEEFLLKLASAQDIIILAGLARKDAVGKIFASHLSVLPKAGIHIYDKVHTAPPEKEFYSAGDDVSIIHSTHLKFGVQLCYDAHFPSLSTHMAKQGAELIVIPHASPRGDSHEKLESWLRHLTARAFDNGIFVAACNQVGQNRNGLTFPGVAVVIGPDGRVVDQKLSASEPAMLVTTLKGDLLEQVRSHKMRYFLPNRREDLYSC